MRKAIRSVCFAVAAFVLLGLIGWAAGAVYFDLPIASLREPLSIIYGAAMAATLFFVRPRGRAIGIVALGFAAVLGWWLTIQPRQDRDWKPEVAVLAYATIEGERVTINNVRNFDYRTETDFTPRYETRSYDLRNLSHIDLFVTYWGSALMAHPVVSFDFGPDGRVCFSIETRPRRGQGYSAIGGLYRQFEQIYIPADERDVIRVRTNFRKGEDVYLYRLLARPETARSAFLEYVSTLNALHQHARWYNVLGNNCTTAIRNQRAAGERAPWDWRILANGYADGMLYERGTIERFSLPFAELKSRSRINERAHAANEAADFSERIRTHFQNAARSE